MSEENYLESRGRRIKRHAVRLTPGILGAVAGGLTADAVGIKGVGNVMATLGTGALADHFIGNPLVKHLDKRDLRRAGFNPHESSMILGSRYAPEGSYIKFNSGNVYRYPHLTKKRLRQMSEAESTGKYFNQHLKRLKNEKIGKL